jgi:hypothetical protein
MRRTETIIGQPMLAASLSVLVRQRHLDKQITMAKLSRRLRARHELLGVRLGVLGATPPSMAT